MLTKNKDSTKSTTSTNSNDLVTSMHMNASTSTNSNDSLTSIQTSTSTSTNKLNTPTNSNDLSTSMNSTANTINRKHLLTSNLTTSTNSNDLLTSKHMNPSTSTDKLNTPTNSNNSSMSMDNIANKSSSSTSTNSNDSLTSIHANTYTSTNSNDLLTSMQTSTSTSTTKALLSANKATSNENDVCTNTAGDIDEIVYNPQNTGLTDTSSDDTSYYSELQNNLYATQTYKFESGSDDVMTIGAAKTDIISGALNIHFQFSDEIYDSKVPNYMKHILYGTDGTFRNGTFFECIRGLIDSENFLASFDSVVGSTVTPSHVKLQNLSNIDNVYVRNVYGARSYTVTSACNVLGAVMYQFNKLIDAVIKNNWQGYDMKTIEEYYDDHSSGNMWDYTDNMSINSVSSDAEAAVVNTFFSTVIGTTHYVYKEFMMTLVLPAILHHIALEYENEEEPFYYLGYIPTGASCTVDKSSSSSDSIGTLIPRNDVSSDYRPSDYSVTDSSQFDTGLNVDETSNLHNLMESFKIAYTSDTDPLLSLYEKAISNTKNDDGTYNTLKDIYTFPEDMTVYSYLVKKYAKYIIFEIQQVIIRMRYFPVLMNRFYSACLSNTLAYPYSSESSAGAGFDYVEPCIGIPIYRSELLGDYMINTCSHSLSKNSTDEVNLDNALNNVIRDITYDGTNSNLLEKYAEAMITDSGGKYYYVNIPGLIFDIENTYGDVTVDTTDVIDGSNKYSDLFYAFDDDSTDLDKISKISNNSIKLSINLTEQEGNYNTVTGGYRNTARISYKVYTATSQNKSNVSYRYFTFIYNTYDVTQFIKESTTKTGANYNLSIDSSGRESENENVIINKALTCNYTYSISGLPSMLKNNYDELNDNTS